VTELIKMLRAPLNPIIGGAVSACLLIGALAIMIESRAAILRHGTEILFKTEPVDPRDLMRGDYVRLQYEGISSPDGALFVGDWPDRDRLVPVWLTLMRDQDGFAEVKSISITRPADRSDGQVLLKSKPVMLLADSEQRTRGSRFALSFGIERYYVPEGEGLEIENARNAGRTTAAVRISDDGAAQIARLMIDGETLYEEPLY
jgi:uncharacterized membrane-anchored protein